MSNSKYEGNKNKLLRVTQMNAAFFDKEIEGIFWQQIQECLEYLPVSIQYIKQLYRCNVFFKYAFLGLISI